MKLSNRKYAAILAGLRLLQVSLKERRVRPDDGDIGSILTDGGTLKALSIAEIDSLCEALNAPAEPASGQAREVPLDPNIQADFVMQPGEAYDHYAQRGDAAFDRLMEKSRAIPDNEVVGAMINFPIADGRAYYLVTSDKPLKLAHVPFCDAYRVHAALLRGLTLGDVKGMVASDRAMAASFKRRRP